MNHHEGEKEASSSDTERGEKGNVIKVTPADLITRNEKVEFEARKEFYEKLVYTNKRSKRLQKFQFIGKTILPAFIISFSALYFMYGLAQINH